MPIENRNLKPGTRLVGRYHKQQYKCEVVEREGGKLGYRLEDGREFKSPSAAGMAITGHACDGWVFWSIETTPAPAAQEGETASTQTDRRCCDRRGQEGGWRGAEEGGASNHICSVQGRIACWQETPLARPQSEGCAGGPDPLALLRVRQELPGSHGQDSRELPARAPYRLTWRDYLESLGH